MENFLQWLGAQVGTALRFVVEVLGAAVAGVDDFVTGLATSLGMSATAWNLALLVVGVFLLYRGVRKLVGRAFLAGFVRVALAVLLLGWLIN